MTVRDPRARRLVVVAALALAAATGVGALAFVLRDGDDATVEPASADPGPVHVHGLGVDPADGALYLATHTGLYRVAPGERRAQRVGDSYQDTMGFTVVGPNHFLGSGHPDLRDAQADDLPPRLGLVESRDAGRTWRPVSLLGEADFHVLRHAQGRIYGYDVLHERLLVTRDGGRTWDALSAPGRVVDLAVHPAAPSTLLAVVAGGDATGLFSSRDAGRRWERVSDAVALLAWPAPSRLYLVGGDGRVFASADEGASASPVGDAGGEPAALLGVGAEELLVALHDGTVKRSVDGGATWTVRSAP